MYETGGLAPHPSGLFAHSAHLQLYNVAAGTFHSPHSLAVGGSLRASMLALVQGEGGCDAWVRLFLCV